MPELEHALVELGRGIELPPAPDLAAAVRRRIAEEPRRRFRLPPRRVLALAVAVLLVAVGAVLAVPPARTAILDWLGLSGVKIVRVEKLPPTPLRTDLGLGREVTLAEAKRRAPWVVVPTGKGVGAPDHVYYSTRIPRGQVALLWGSPAEVRLLMTEFNGEAFIEKLIGPDTTAESVRVNGDPGVWISGPHVFYYRDANGRMRQETDRLSQSALIWRHDYLTLRLEGDLSKHDALRLAASARR
ncbi:MAG TPA: hypothetical protein VGQ68_04705 [Gaiellaceae bacterium]|nr:hypothetical protein [Gaiellaceae bacterium]